MRKHNNNSAEQLLRRAEERLQKEKRRVTSPSTPAELQRLVHELEVHQIELEMQNEELQQARLELESSLAQYTDLYDFAPVGYFSLDPSGLILHVNLTGARLLGVERARLINQPFGRFLTAHSRTAFTAFLAEVFTGKLQKNFEFGLQKERYGRLIVRVEARLFEGGRECRVALMDITTRRQAEELLRESEQKYRTLFETMSQGVVHQGQDGKIVSVNPAGERILGLSMDQLQARPWADPRWRFIREDGSEFPGETHPSMVALRTGKAVHNVILGVSSPEADRFIWLNMNAVPHFLPGEEKPSHVFIVFEDITDRKHMVVYSNLTDREKEVINLLGKGFSRKMIGETLSISPKTVDKHKENLIEKLDFYTIEEIVESVKLIGLVKS